MVGKAKDPDKKKEKSKEGAKEGAKEGKAGKKDQKKEVRKEKQLRVIVRVVGTDLDGEKKILYAIRKIKGISYSMAKAVCSVTGINPDEKLGSLNEEGIAKIEAAVKDPAAHGVPVWFLNRRRDPETGSNLHLSGMDVQVAEKFDIKALVDMKSRRGERHMLGQPVRGQRTRSSFRKGKAVGVVRKKLMPATAGQKQEKGK